ncbi:hypothetical protein C5F52_06350 [Limnohabitans sp. TS-CS-82]|jgi:hypothetical protein|uniref:hypothetical protein n=1 Tax=Limnohabitans sp. TS-CS-82 TaxID=2094193 RepID=UPI000CF228D2|nr:hypothetical protein [Limnohabitans sp. TS-CS-82]PQA84060.1 hypothetical protein C5F52_06350 [Limnohabitans sp. TS-CS-82]
MSNLLKLAFPRNFKLFLQRKKIDQIYSKEISMARKTGDHEKMRSLEQDYFFDIALHEEEEDAFLTNKYLSKARQLHLSVPHRNEDDGKTSKYWYEGRYTGCFYLTPLGFASLRENIRQELKARHDARAHWAVWLSALTGVIGAITGLASVLSK